MKYRDISELSNKELKEILADEKINYAKLKISHAVSPIDNPMKLKETRKKIARLITNLRKRELDNKIQSENGKQHNTAK